MTEEHINETICEVTGVKRDYYHCLNAMHEAEKVLTQDQWWLFLTNLRDTFNPLPGDPRDKIFVHATAAQRAEAFLRTIGKWEDDK